MILQVSAQSKDQRPPRHEDQNCTGQTKVTDVLQQRLTTGGGAERGSDEDVNTYKYLTMLNNHIYEIQKMYQIMNVPQSLQMTFLSRLIQTTLVSSVDCNQDQLSCYNSHPEKVKQCSGFPKS